MLFDTRRTSMYIDNFNLRYLNTGRRVGIVVDGVCANGIYFTQGQT